MKKKFIKKFKEMTDKKQNNKEEQEQNKTIENNTEQITTQKEEQKDNNEAKQDNQEKKHDKKETIEDLGQKLIEMNDKYLRLYSEFENYRKRTNKERIDMIQNASEEMIKELLPVVDDYERAIDAMTKENDSNLDKTKEGLVLIYNKLINILTKKGLKVIEAKGQPFDENIHEAVTQFPAQKEEDKGKVIEEVLKGYYLNNKVIRYSKVVVAI